MVNIIGNILSKPIHFNFAVLHATAVRILDHQLKAALQRRINTHESFMTDRKADSVNTSVWTSSQRVPLYGIILVVSRFVNVWETKASSRALQRCLFWYCIPDHACSAHLIYLLFEWRSPCFELCIVRLDSFLQYFHGFHKLSIADTFLAILIFWILSHIYRLSLCPVRCSFIYLFLAIYMFS